MNESIELLKLVYKNAKMGVVGIENIKNGIKDRDFAKLIREQENDYYEMCTKTIKQLSLTNTIKKTLVKWQN